jgi:hypothetical protein
MGELKIDQVMDTTNHVNSIFASDFILISYIPISSEAQKKIKPIGRRIHILLLV